VRKPIPEGYSLVDHIFLGSFSVRKTIPERCHIVQATSMQVICSALKAAMHSGYMQCPESCHRAHACMQVICSALKAAIELMHACNLYAVP
jgi:hypothetical protein